MLADALLLVFLFQATVAASSDATCDSSMTEASYLPSVTCSRDHVSQSLSSLAPCTPRDKVVKVPWPSNSSYDQLTPSHVTVRRCSGGCHGGLTSCVPTSTQLRKVAVLLARCPLGGGSCQKECATLEVEDELACGCGCRLEPSSCRSEDQEWREETCSCQCKDTKATTTCLQVGRVWDHQSCQCLCPPTNPCPADQTHDPSSCSCLPLIGPLEGQERQERQERQEDVLQLNWEHPVILTLASLNLLLISIIVVLVRKHRKMTRRLRERPSHVPAEMSKNLYSTPPRNGTSEPPSVKAALLYTSDSDVSTEQQNTNTDSSYCSDATYRPSPQPSYSPPTEVTYRPSPLPSYASSPYPSPPYSSLVPPAPYPCCSYPSLSSLPVPSSECGQCNTMARNRLPPSECNTMTRSNAPSECNTIVRIAGGGGNGTLGGRETPL